MVQVEQQSRHVGTGSVYARHQYEASYPDGVDAYWWHVARNSVVLEVMDRYVDRELPVLDVGCGRGIAVGFLRKRGIDCSGVDPAPAPPLPEAASFVHTGIRTRDLSAVLRDRCRTVLLLDVVEHLDDPVEFVHELQRDLPAVRHLVVTVPARPELWSNYDDFYGHRRRYTPRSLEAFAADLGATLLYRSYFFRLLYLPAWIYAVTGMERKVEVNPPRPGARWLHRLLAALCLLDFHVLPRQLPGLSLIGCLRLDAAGAR